MGHTNRLNAPYVLQAEEELGSVFLLANCAGYARAAKFEDTAAIDKIKVLFLGFLLIECNN